MRLYFRPTKISSHGLIRKEIMGGNAYQKEPEVPF